MEKNNKLYPIKAKLNSVCVRILSSKTMQWVILGIFVQLFCILNVKGKIGNTPSECVTKNSIFNSITLKCDTCNT